MDRYYIEQFLRRHADDLRGRVLEVGEPWYANLLAPDGAVTGIDVLDRDETNQAATLIVDLGSGAPVPPDARFDCIICTQTLHLVYEVGTAMATLHDLLAPGGVLLVTVPGISQIARDDARRWEDYWRFTTRSMTRLCAERFGEQDVSVEAFGNVRAAAAFLYGLATEELGQSALDYRDPDYDLVVAARARRR